jgi:hypothetical protein
MKLTKRSHDDSDLTANNNDAGYNDNADRCTNERTPGFSNPNRG